MRTRNLNRDAVYRDWQQRGYSLGVWTDLPGQVWVDFVHDCDELLMLIEGELELRMAGHVFRPAVGEEIYISAGVAHTVINIGTVINRWYYGYRR